MLGFHEDSAVSPAVDDLAYYLIAIKGVYPLQMHRLGSEAVIVGRAPGCDLVLADAQLSRTHCRVQLVGRTTLITDLNSTNGTFVNDQLIAESAVLPVGGYLRIGHHVFQLALRSVREVEAALALDRDLMRASDYVQALLPPPLSEGPVLTDWMFVPSTRLGGDGFGYAQLDQHRFSSYIFDVAGHGTGAAMHSVSIMNLLRNRELSNIDMASPLSVVTALNAIFPMTAHDSLFFTIWYGVYDTASRLLQFCSAGHHPAHLRSGRQRPLIRLRTPGPAIGVLAGFDFQAGSVSVEPGSSLYLFSDGIFDGVRQDGSPFRLTDLEQLIMQPALTGCTEPQRLYEAARQITAPQNFADDASLLVIRYP